MAIRYSAEFLLHLRDSPLCTRPPNLPPSEEWMGSPELVRAQASKAGPNERPRTNDSSLLDQPNRRPLDRQASRSNANPDDIVFGPPRMAFSSARGNRASDGEKTTSRDVDAQGRTGTRHRSGEHEGDRLRDGRSNPLRRRGEADQDSDGWNVVKPRKSFGAEGAERFHGKMGGSFRDDRRPAREGNKDDRDGARERHGRAFDVLARGDREAPDVDVRPRNGLGSRNKADSWRASEGGDAPTAPAPEKRDRDKTRSWRDRDRDADPSDERNAGRSTNDRRWGRDRDRERDRDRGSDRDRDQRVEREPEWLDEPAEAREAHTQQDFQKWMEQMKKAKTGSASSNVKSTAEVPAETTKPALPAAALEAGPDKFFLAFGGASAGTDVSTPGEQNETSVKPKAGGKSSRFTSFFTQPPADSRPPTDSSTSHSGPGPGANGSDAPAALSVAVPSGLEGLFGASAPSGITASAGAPEEEKQAFKQLLAKLHKASMSATPPAPSPFAAPPPAATQDANPQDVKKNAVGSPVPFQQYTGSYDKSPLVRPPSLQQQQQQLQQEILAPRPQQQSARPEQLLQDLVGGPQHHHQRVSSQGSNARPAFPGAARNNSNTEFLMKLMKMAATDGQQDQRRVASHPQVASHQMLKHSAMPPVNNDREQEFMGREERNNEMRPQPPPGFSVDESYHNNPESEARQPTQILQRPPPPPGLDQMPPSWMAAGGGQMPPPPQQQSSHQSQQQQQRGGPMMPPPGLIGGPGGSSRNLAMPPPIPPPQLFPPSFAPGGMPLPESMGGMPPPRNMAAPPPPPGFFNGPPHVFLPPGMGGFNGLPSGPEGFGGPPFEARGMPPPSGAGNGGRGGNFGRP